MKGRTGYILLGIIGLGLILRIFMIQDPYLHTWDEQYHALVAKNLIDTPLHPRLYKHAIEPYDYKNWTGNATWLHKPPMALWLIATSIKCFGTHAWAVRIPSLLCSIIGIYLTFLIGRRLFNPVIGLWGAFFHSINGLMLEMTAGRVSTDHVDIVFITLTQMSIYFILIADRKIKIHVLAGLIGGAAYLTKSFPALLIFPLWLILHYPVDRSNRRKIIENSLAFLLSFSIIAVPWNVYSHLTFPLESNWERMYSLMHFTQDIEGHRQPWYYYLNRMRIMYGELIYIPILLFLVHYYKTRRKHILFILAWIFIPIISFSLSTSKMPGYILLSAPAFFLVTGWSIKALKRHYLEKKNWYSMAIIIALVALPIRYSVERIKPWKSQDLAKADYIENVLLSFAQTEAKKDLLFNTKYPIQAMFYGSVTAYNHMPSSSRIQELISDGYRIYIDSEADSLGTSCPSCIIVILEDSIRE